MLNFYLNTDFKIIDRDIESLVQFSTNTINLYIPYTDTNNVVSYSLVRPDGYKTNEVYFKYIEEIEAGVYLWRASISAYHTLNIPGTEDTGKIIISFILKNIINGETQYIKLSPIIKLTVIRSETPLENEIEPNVIDDIQERLHDLELSNLDHTVLTLSSRSQPNAHPISAITSLTEEIGVYTGENEPENGEKTWFKTISEEQEILEWQTLVNTPTIAQDAVFAYDIPSIFPIRLVVVGEINGEYIIQYLENTDDPYKIEGEVIIYVDDLIFTTVFISILLTTTTMTVNTFTNTGNVDVLDFSALRLEVYK